MKQALLIFAKNLEYGKVKTRLAATIGNDKAFNVYKELLKHTAAITKDLTADRLIFYSEHVEPSDIWNENIYQKKVQIGEDLGDKMFHAFAEAFELGYKQVVIIGTDCLDLSKAIIVDAFEQLNNHDVVIGPAKDGGYYLLGLCKLHRALFENIEWSTNTVLQKTILACKQLQLYYHCLQELSDVDEEKDLHGLNLILQ